MRSARLYLTSAESLDLVTRLDDLAQLEPETTIPRIRAKLLKAMGLDGGLPKAESSYHRARAALAAHEEPRTDSLIDFPEESLEELRELVAPLEELPNSDRLLRLIDKALEVKRRGL